MRDNPDYYQTQKWKSGGAGRQTCENWRAMAMRLFSGGWE